MNIVLEEQLNQIDVMQTLLEILEVSAPEITLKNDEPVIDGKTVDVTHPAE